MKKSEVILLSLAGVAVLVVGGLKALDYVEPGNGQGAVQGSAVPPGLDQVLGQVQDVLGSQGLSQKDLYEISMANRAWAKDPFESKPPGPKVEEAGESVQEEKPLAYEGYIHIGDEWLAIINGREYGSGEPVEDTGFVVTKIGEKQVVLVRKSGGGQSPETKTLPIVENEYDYLKM